MALAPTVVPILEQEIVRYALTGLHLVSTKKIFSILERAHGDDCAQDLMDRGLIACSATDAHDAVSRPPVILHHSFSDLKLP